LKGEVLQILNHVPTTEEDLAIVVDYDEQRFVSREQWAGIVGVVHDHLVAADAMVDHADSGAEHDGG
jgi:hypothetical protein